jgi:hypothetical protein
LAANVILKNLSGVGNSSITDMIVPLKADNVTYGAKGDDFKKFGHMFFLAIWVPLVYSTVYKIVLEKQNKLQETMRIMGMSELAYWGSWLTTYTILNTIISIVGTIILSIFFFSRTMTLCVFLLLWGFG